MHAELVQVLGDIVVALQALPCFLAHPSLWWFTAQIPSGCAR